MNITLSFPLFLKLTVSNKKIISSVRFEARKPQQDIYKNQWKASKQATHMICMWKQDM